MSVTLEYIADCAVDTGTISIFNTNLTRLSRSQQRLAHLATDHVPGLYQVMIRELDGRPSALYLIHTDNVNFILSSLPDNEILEMKTLDQINVRGSLLVSDPSYVYDDLRVEPLFPRYLLCLWGRDERAAQEWLNRNQVPFEIWDSGIRIYGNERPRLEIILRRLRSELGQVRHDFKLCDWLKDSSNLYDQIQLNYKPRILSYTRNDEIFEGAVTNTGYGDGVYQLQAFKYAGQIVGYRMVFIEDEDSGLDDIESDDDED
jgi:hypothetical protein